MHELVLNLRNLGTIRLAAIAGVGVGLALFFVFLSTRLETTNMSLLYGDLEPSDSSQIVAKLEAMNVPFELRAEGRQIMVPSDRALRLRMAMAQEGLPSGGSVGYEIFDRSEGLGATSFVQNVNLLRAMEGELARTIRALDSVQEARVHIVLPKRELFSRKTVEATASVVIKPRGGSLLDRAEVQAIQQLVAASVPGLAPGHVAVIDTHGRLHTRNEGEDENAPGLVAARNEDLRRSFQSRMGRRIEELLEQSVGIGRVRVEVTADMDFDRLVTNSETYDPDGQVVRSTQSVEETAQTRESDAQSVTVANNLPDAAAANQSGPGNLSRSGRSEETVNYEISKTVKEHVRETGTVKRLSVAVLVDGRYVTGPEGAPVYQPRSQEELDKLAALVRSAIGFDADRGDKLELVNMQFAQIDTGEVDTPEPLFGLTKSDYFRIAEMFVLAVVGVLVILLVVRPLVARTLDALPSALEAAAEQSLLADQSVETPALEGPGGVGEDEEDDEMIDLQRVEGRVKASTLRKISEIVDRHPEETVSILRQWMYEDA